MSFTHYHWNNKCLNRKSPKKTCGKKKKERFCQKQNQQWQKNSILATEINATELNEFYCKKKKDKNRTFSDGTACDLS